MRLESAIFSSASSLQAHAGALSVIGDNVANSNTVGYKESRVEFSDMVAEGDNGRNSTALPVGGNGVDLQKVSQVHVGGLIEDTGRQLDVAIEGRGFFVVGTDTDTYYTRAGNFDISEDGLLVNSSGYNVMGYAGATGTSLGAIDMYNVDTSGDETTTAALSGNLASSATTTATPASPDSYNDINALATFTTSLPVYDSLGFGHDVNLSFFKTDVNEWTVQGYMSGENITGGTEGVPTQLGSDLAITFQTDGTIATADQADAVLALTPAYSNGATQGNFSIDLSGFTQYGTTSQLTSVSQDGLATGDIENYAVTADGELRGVLTSGASVVIARLPIANFPNLSGLSRAGNDLFFATSQAGTEDVSTPGGSGLGSLRGSSLERSNVDIANQFVNLVVYQRGYQANSQMLNAASDIMRDTISLLR